VAVKSARRRSREFAVQGLYSWLLSRASESDIEKQFADAQGFDKADRAFFSELLTGTIQSAPELDVLLEPMLDRKPGELSPVEHAILLMAAHELKSSALVPYRVVINEAVELAKSFGGTDGHKYVNGVLDKLARSMRPDDADSEAAPRARPRLKTTSARKR
jgi:N utilization substance protein B